MLDAPRSAEPRGGSATSLIRAGAVLFLVLVVGLASFVGRMPEWVPILIGITIPGSVVIMAGTYRRLRFTRDMQTLTEKGAR